MKIHALSTDHGGCHFYRLRTPLAALRPHGHDTSWGTGISAARLSEIDVLVLQLTNGEQDLEAFRALVTAIRDRGRRQPLIVYEVDDDLFTIDQVITPEINPEVLWKEQATQARVREFIALADLVTVSTPYLAQLYGGLGTPVTVLRNAVPDWILDFPVAEPDDFVVGWTASASHLMDARHWIDAFDRFMNAHRSVRWEWHGLNAVGHGWGPRSSFHPWVGDVVEYLGRMPGRLSVGIAPLGPFEFNKGKSGIKVDEYAAWGVPAVASNFDQYHDTIVNGETGYLVDSFDQWVSCMNDLYRHAGKRRRMGMKAREAVAERTIGKTCLEWVKTYGSAINAA